jgi:hypothetical protein
VCWFWLLLVSLREDERWRRVVVANAGFSALEMKALFALCSNTQGELCGVERYEGVPVPAVLAW